MFPYNRLYQIFDKIKNQSPIRGNDLSSTLKVSERTIRSDIQIINEILEKNGAQIELKRKTGYFLHIENQQLFNTFLSQLNKQSNDTLELDTTEDRIRFLLRYLLYNKEYATLDELANLVYISKNTLLNYIKIIKNTVEKYNLEYISKTSEGCKIIGSEDMKRRCILENVLSHDMSNYITGFTKEEYSLFEGINIEKIREIIINKLNYSNLTISDYNLKNLILHFALTVSRIINHCPIDHIMHIDLQNEIRESIDEIMYELEKEFDITINDAERNYIYSHYVINTNYSLETIQTDEIKRIVNNLLDNVYTNYSFDLRNDETLANDLFLHFRSILSTKSFSLDKKNPLLNTIKNNFPLAFEITLTAVSNTFASLPYSLTEDEVGYVALHIGAAIERCFSGVIQRKKVILVCGSGNATTRMLEARINAFFRDKIVIYKRVSYNEFLNLDDTIFKNIDFAISTIPISEHIVPTICVDFALNQKDIEAISRFMGTISSSKSKKIHRFFDKELFINNMKFTSKDELLKEMCRRLKEQGSTDDLFYTSVMKRESIANTNMNDVFALPHSMELCALETKVAVAILKEPIPWTKDNTVQIVMLLAIKQNEHLDIEYLYDIFIEIVNNTRLQNEIIHAKDYQQFIDILGNGL